MVQATPFLLVLFLALGAHGHTVKKVLSGWGAQGGVGRGLWLQAVLWHKC